MAIIVAISVIAFFVISSGYGYIVKSISTIEIVEEPARDLPTQIIKELNDNTPSDIIEYKEPAQQERINNKVVVDNTALISLGNTKKQNTPIIVEELKEEKNIRPVISSNIEIVDVEEEFIEPEVKLSQNIAHEEIKQIIEEDSENKINVDSFKVAFWKE